MVKQCKENQILNQISQRCVQYNGTHFKKLLQEQLETGKKYFLKDDLEKFVQIKATTKPVVPPTKPVVPPTKPVVPPTKPDVPTTKPDVPTTKPDVPTTKPVVPPTKPVVPPTIKSATSVNTKISKNVVNKMKAFVEKFKKHRYEEEKNKKDIMNLCDNKSTTKTLLNFPIVRKESELTFTYYTYDLKNMTLKNKLNKDLNIQSKIFDRKLKSFHTTLFAIPEEQIKLRFNENNIDYEWFVKNNEYIASLSKKEIFTIYGYTYYGDQLMKKYIFGKLDVDRLIRSIDLKDYHVEKYFPFFFQLMDIIKELPVKDIVADSSEENKIMNLRIVRFKQKIDKYESEDLYNLYKNILENVKNMKKNILTLCIDRYIADLSTIIENAPATTKTMKVYRGVEDDYYFKNRKKNVYFKNETFVSTSFNPDIAHIFKNKYNKCCISEITLLPGTKCLWISGVSHFPGENEILLNINTTYLIRSHKVEHISTPNIDFLKKMCNNKKLQTALVSSIVAL